MAELTHALKEWQVAVQALEQGDTIVLLRKGGIREAGGKFGVQQQQVWLYPTFEHQNPALLKPRYAAQVQRVEPGWHPAEVRIGAWATVTDDFLVDEAEPLQALLPHHIWNQQFVTERLRWQPKQPVHVLLLRVHRLEQPQTIAYTPAYGGCKSWIQLTAAIATDNSQPVLNDADYSGLVAQIQTTIASVSSNPASV